MKSEPKNYPAHPDRFDHWQQVGIHRRWKNICPHKGSSTGQDSRRSSSALFLLFQVLGRESITGSPCYWEVDWNGTEIDIAVTYRGIRRKGNGNECSLGWNDKSWSLYCSDSKYSFVHNNKSTDIAGPVSPRIGVYLDHAAGTLAFYSVSNGIKLLHRFQTTFTEPLYPAFSVWGFGTTLRL